MNVITVAEVSKGSVEVSVGWWGTVPQTYPNWYEAINFVASTLNVAIRISSRLKEKPKRFRPKSFRLRISDEGIVAERRVSDWGHMSLVTREFGEDQTQSALQWAIDWVLEVVAESDVSGPVPPGTR